MFQSVLVLRCKRIKLRQHGREGLSAVFTATGMINWSIWWSWFTIIAYVVALLDSAFYENCLCFLRKSGKLICEMNNLLLSECRFVQNISATVVFFTEEDKDEQKKLSSLT